MASFVWEAHFLLCIIAHIDSLLRQPLLVPEPSLSLSLFPTSYSLEFSASLKIFLFCLRLSCATAIASFLLTTLKSLSVSPHLVWLLCRPCLSVCSCTLKDPRCIILLIKARVGSREAEDRDKDKAAAATAAFKPH